MFLAEGVLGRARRLQALQFVDEHRAVGQAGEAVVAGQLPHLARGQHAGGDVAGHAAVARETALRVEGGFTADAEVHHTPAFAQHDLARRVAPLLEPGQVVYLPPGTFGSYVFAKAAHDAGRAKGVSFAETGTLPWLARKQGPYEVRISGRGVRLPTGVFPLTSKAHALEVIGAAFPRAIEDCGDILSGALMNAGPIIHPPLITMNAGPLEHFDRWDIHKEGTQPAIRRVTDQLDAERMAVREAFGYGAPHFPLADHYAKRKWMYEAEAHDTLTDSGDWRERIVLTQHRYMLEDTRIGLSFIISMAELANVPTPLAKSFLSIGSAIVGENFMQTGRTRKTLGIDAMSKDELQSFLAKGFA